jgi:hypothetical protein
VAFVCIVSLGMIAPPADVAMEKLGTTIEPAVVLDAISLFAAVIAVAVPLVNVDVGLVIAPVEKAMVGSGFVALTAEPPTESGCEPSGPVTCADAGTAMESAKAMICAPTAAMNRFMICAPGVALI